MTKPTITSTLALLVPAAMDRVELQQVGRRGRVTAAVVDVDDGDSRPAPEGPKEVPADAAKAIDPDVHCRSRPGAPRQINYI